MGVRESWKIISYYFNRYVAPVIMVSISFVAGLFTVAELLGDVIIPFSYLIFFGSLYFSYKVIEEARELEKP